MGITSGDFRVERRVVIPCFWAGKWIDFWINFDFWRVEESGGKSLVYVLVCFYFHLHALYRRKKREEGAGGRDCLSQSLQNPRFSSHRQGCLLKPASRDAIRPSRDPNINHDNLNFNLLSTSCLVKVSILARVSMERRAAIDSLTFFLKLRELIKKCKAYSLF